MVEVRPCGCSSVFDGSGHVVSVGTCPQCLPVGSMEYLIENGRQLDIFEGPPEPLRGSGGTHWVSGHASDDHVKDKRSGSVLDSGLPF